MVALVVTIVVLLILAGITLIYVVGDNSVFKQASDAKLKTEIAKAREKLEVVLSSVKIEKHTDSKYNENEYLDEYITGQIKEAEVIDDIAIIDGYAFELDRSVPKIGEYIGKREELELPEINILGPDYASDYRTAKFTITAKEEKNGISKIEIIQYGQVIDTFEYENVKDEITKEYTAKQNGIYKVKVHSKTNGIAKVEVTEIVMAVEYSPNGNKEYKKEHSSKITIKESGDKVKNIKYQWTNSLTEPEEGTFTQSCSNNSTIIGKGITGTYYLWTLLETESGKKNICRSEGFNFDNEGPMIINFTAEKYSIDGITLSASAQDIGAGIAKFEFYIDNELKGIEEISTTEIVTRSINITGLNTGEHTCMVKVYDLKNNNASNSKSGTTKLYAWTKYNCNERYTYKEEREIPLWASSNQTCIKIIKKSIDETEGKYSIKTESAGTSLHYFETGEFFYSSVKTGLVDRVFQKIDGNTFWVYTLVKTTSYERGNALETVTDISNSKFPDNARANDGFWYTKTDPQ